MRFNRQLQGQSPRGPNIGLSELLEGTVASGYPMIAMLMKSTILVSTD